METGTKIPLLIIAGPTATGKTEVAVRVAEKLGGEVISADSMLVYRHMDIGTAKPTREEKRGIPHHLIDVADPDEEFTVAVYQELARRAIEEVYGRGNIPILAGGTGFYVDAVVYDYDFSRVSADPELRRSLWREAGEKGGLVLYERLRQVDPETAARIHPNNLKRVIRALEIYHRTGTPGALRRGENRREYPRYDKLFFCLYFEREKLYHRIEKRVDLMVRRGLVHEVRGLLERGYRPELVSMQGLGYKEIVWFLHNRCPLEEAVDLLKRNTRRFAKRQLTWFRRYSNIKWIDMDRYDSIERVADEIAVLAGEKWQVEDREKK